VWTVERLDLAALVFRGFGQIRIGIRANSHDQLQFGRIAHFADLPVGIRADTTKFVHIAQDGNALRRFDFINRFESGSDGFWAGIVGIVNDGAVLDAAQTPQPAADLCYRSQSIENLRVLKPELPAYNYRRKAGVKLRLADNVLGDMQVDFPA